MSDPKQQTVTLTMDQLKDLAKAFGEEFRKPPEPTEAEAAQIENDLRMRRERGGQELQKIENRKLIQSICEHLRTDGTSRAVHIFGSNNLTDYMICQECTAMIHAEPRPTEGPLAKEFENHIFNTQLFNKHYLKSQQRTTF
jgi:hypothetical protein